MGLSIPTGDAIASTAGIAGEVLRRGLPILVDDLEGSAFPAHPERCYASSSCMAVPIRGRGATRGVVCAADPDRGNAFSSDQLEQFRLLGIHLGVCIDSLLEAFAVAEIDSLTGLFTRRAFVRRLEEEVERSRRYGLALSLLMLHLDNLERINELEGHRAGDQVVIRVARSLLDAVRRVELAASFGGDEFAVLLPETGAPESRKAALRIADTLERAAQGTGGRLAARLRVRAGAATMESSGTARDLVDQASRALHLARADRERIRHVGVGGLDESSRLHSCTCGYCGEVFLVKTQARQEARRYCSRRCATAARRSDHLDRNSTIIDLRRRGLTLQARGLYRWSGTTMSGSTGWVIPMA